MGQVVGDEVSTSRYEAVVKPECLLVRRACDALGIGLVVVDITGRLQFANEAAKRFLLCARGIEVRNGRVAMTATSTQIQLYGLLAAIAGGGSEEGSLFAATDNGDHVLISVSPLPIDGLPNGPPSSGMALLVISDPMKVGHGNPMVLMKLFGLTRKEAELAQALLAGGTLGEYASLRSVCYGTVRSQLRAIFAKTGVRRQAELVRLLTHVSEVIVK